MARGQLTLQSVLEIIFIIILVRIKLSRKTADSSLNNIRFLPGVKFNNKMAELIKHKKIKKIVKWLANNKG